MAGARNLRVATEDDAPKKPKTLIQAAQSGTYREILMAQQLDIARSLENPETQGPARAALHRQLGLVARELKDMNVADAEEASERGNVGDEAFDASAV